MKNLSAKQLQELADLKKQEEENEKYNNSIIKVGTLKYDLFFISQQKPLYDQFLTINELNDIINEIIEYKIPKNSIFINEFDDQWWIHDDNNEIILYDYQAEKYLNIKNVLAKDFEEEYSKIIKIKSSLKIQAIKDDHDTD